jgi:hypothetical protein
LYESLGFSKVSEEVIDNEIIHEGKKTADKVNVFPKKTKGE